MQVSTFQLSDNYSPVKPAAQLNLGAKQLTMVA